MLHKNLCDRCKTRCSGMDDAEPEWGEPLKYQFPQLLLCFSKLRISIALASLDSVLWLVVEADLVDFLCSMFDATYWSSSGTTLPAIRSQAHLLSSLQSFEKAFPLKMVIQSLLLRLVGSIIISNLRKEKEKSLIWSEFISKVEYLETIKMRSSGDRDDDLYP